MLFIIKFPSKNIMSFSKKGVSSILDIAGYYCELYDNILHQCGHQC